LIADLFIQAQISLAQVLDLGLNGIETLEAVDAPALPGSGNPSDETRIRQRGHVTLSLPLDNFGPSLPNLIATIAGI